MSNRTVLAFAGAAALMLGCGSVAFAVQTPSLPSQASATSKAKAEMNKARAAMSQQEAEMSKAQAQASAARAQASKERAATTGTMASSAGAAQPPLTAAQIESVQEALDKTGDHLRVDGILGKHTRDDLMSFQRAHGLPVTGQADAATRHALGLN